MDPSFRWGDGEVLVRSASETARVLVQALPYIERFHGKSVVVKLGGAAIDQELDRALAQDVLLLRSVGVRWSARSTATWSARSTA